MDYREQLVRLVECFASAKGRSEATIANLAGRDGRFFQRLRDGKTCSVDTLNHLLRWFSDHWPVDLAWPDGVTRPTNPTPSETPPQSEAA